MQISRTRHKGENNNGKWRLGMQIDLMKRQGLGRSLFCSCTDDSPRLVLLHPRSDPYKLYWGGEREARERFKSLNIVHLPCPRLLLPKSSHTSLESNPSHWLPKTGPLSCRSHCGSQAPPVPHYGGAAASRGPRGPSVPAAGATAPKCHPRWVWHCGTPCSPPGPSQGSASPLGLFSSPFPFPPLPMEWLWNKILVLAGIYKAPHGEGVTSHSLDMGQGITRSSRRPLAPFEEMAQGGPQNHISTVVRCNCLFPLKTHLRITGSWNT